MNQYTVLIMRPDGDPLDTYLAHVDADNDLDGLFKAQTDAASADGRLDDWTEYTALVMFPGHLEDLL